MNQPSFDPQTGQPRRATNPWMVVLVVVGACGGLGLVLTALVAAILFPAFANAREAARKTSCAANVKMLSTALLMYASDNDERFPRGGVWHTSLTKYLPESAQDVCPSRRGTVPGYAYSQRLSGASSLEFPHPESEPAIFESSIGKSNGSDLLQSFAMPHRNTGIVGFVDGHVKALESAPPTAPPQRSPEHQR